LELSRWPRIHAAEQPRAIASFTIATLVPAGRLVRKVSRSAAVVSPEPNAPWFWPSVADGSLA